MTTRNNRSTPTRRASGRGGGFRVSPQFVAAHPEADPTATELVINLLEAANLVQGQLDQLLRPHGLATGSFNVLQIVAGADEAITPTDIVARIRVPVTTATVTGVLDTLERKAWIERRRHPDDRRRILVDITPAGRAVLAAVVPAVVEHEQEWTAGIGKARRVALADELATLADHVRGLEGR